VLDFVAAEVERSEAELRVELEIATQANADLIVESDQLALVTENLSASLETAYGDKAALSGRLAQVEAERDEARHEAVAERVAAESARTDLAKALLRLEAMPRLEDDLNAIREALEKERVARVKADQEAAVAAARTDAAREAQQALERTFDESRRQGREREAELSDLRAELKKARATVELMHSEQHATVGRPRARASLNAPRA